MYIVYRYIYNDKGGAKVRTNKERNETKDKIKIRQTENILKIRQQIYLQKHTYEQREKK